MPIDFQFDPDRTVLGTVFTTGPSAAVTPFDLHSAMPYQTMSATAIKVIAMRPGVQNESFELESGDEPSSLSFDKSSDEAT